MHGLIILMAYRVGVVYYYSIAPVRAQRIPIIMLYMEVLILGTVL